jgi:hypothetical protein
MVLTADDFIAIIRDSTRSFMTFGPVAKEMVNRGLTDPFWKGRLTTFFNAGPTSPFKRGKRRFERFTGEDAASFSHPKNVYAGYEATEKDNPNSLGTLRLWDFGSCDTERRQSGTRPDVGASLHHFTIG